MLGPMGTTGNDPREKELTMLIEIGKGLTIEVDCDKARAASPDVANRVDRIGFKNILQDSHASAVRSKFQSDKEYRDESMALAQKSLDAMYAGKVRAAKGATTRTPSDPIGAEAMRMARVAIYTAAKKDGQIAKWGTAFNLPFTESKDSEKAIVAEAIKRYAALPGTIATATSTVDAQKALVVDVNAL